MASCKDTATFFLEGDTKQFDEILKLYPQALKLKAEKKTKKPEELIKLDNWYQNELPNLIKARGKDAHLVHEELVQLMKWKQTRGKFYPQLSYLVKVNTPRAVMQETKKAFRKMPNIEQAITALSNLKGVGTTTASALLAAADPDVAPFMADECLKAIPEMDGIDYTAKEYLNFVAHIRNTCDRLNKELTEKSIPEEQNGATPTSTTPSTTPSTSTLKWGPHQVEMAVWAHCVMSELNPTLLGVPNEGKENGAAQAPLETSDESNLEPPHLTNGKMAAESLDEATTSCTEDSMDKAASPLPPTKRSSEVMDGSSEENSLGVEDEAAPPAKRPRASPPSQ